MQMYDDNDGDDLSRHTLGLWKEYCKPPQEFDTTRGQVIHYGFVASGDKILEWRDAKDRLVKQYGRVLCLEREASALIRVFPGLLYVVYGACNLEDSRDWKRFSAIAAAAYVKDLIVSMTTEVYNRGGGEPFSKSYSPIGSSKTTMSLQSQQGLELENWQSRFSITQRQK